MHLGSASELGRRGGQAKGALARRKRAAIALEADLVTAEGLQAFLGRLLGLVMESEGDTLEVARVAVMVIREAGRLLATADLEKQFEELVTIVAMTNPEARALLQRRIQ